MNEKSQYLETFSKLAELLGPDVPLRPQDGLINAVIGALREVMKNS